MAGLQNAGGGDTFGGACGAFVCGGGVSRAAASRID